MIDATSPSLLGDYLEISRNRVFFFFSFSGNQTIFLKSIVSTTQRRKRRTMTRMFSENDTRTNLGNERYLERVNLQGSVAW